MFNELEKDYLVIDNFLDDSAFLNIEKDFITSELLPLYFQPIVAAPTGTSCENVPWSYAFKHEFYYKDFPQSDWGIKLYNTFMPKFDEVLKKYLNSEFKTLMRAKLNFFPHTETIREYDKHVDRHYPHYGAVFSLNTCDGFTRIGKDIKIDSIKNRIVFFDSSTEHNSTTTTNAPGRWNINFNFL